MATRFHLSDGRGSDLIATTLGEFFVRNVEDFFEFAEVAKLERYRRRRWWLKLWDIVRLKVPPRNPYPNEPRNVDAGALRYANRHRFAQLGVFQVGLIGAPESYARASYHAVHTFWVTGPDGTRRPVRYAKPQNMSPAVPHDQQSIEKAKRDCRHDEHIHRSDPRQRGCGGTSSSLGTAGLLRLAMYLATLVCPDINAELEEFSMDPRRSPQRIGNAHLADKLA